MLFAVYLFRYILKMTIPCYLIESFSRNFLYLNELVEKENTEINFFYKIILVFEAGKTRTILLKIE